jgi:hypothetical protein
MTEWESYLASLRTANPYPPFVRGDEHYWATSSAPQTLLVVNGFDVMQLIRFSPKPPPEDFCMVVMPSPDADGELFRRWPTVLDVPAVVYLGNMDPLEVATFLVLRDRWPQRGGRLTYLGVSDAYLSGAGVGAVTSRYPLESPELGKRLLDVRGEARGLIGPECASMMEAGMGVSASACVVARLGREGFLESVFSRLDR